MVSQCVCLSLPSLFCLWSGYLCCSASILPVICCLLPLQYSRARYAKKGAKYNNDHFLSYCVNPRMFRLRGNDSVIAKSFPTPQTAFCKSFGTQADFRRKRLQFYFFGNVIVTELMKMASRPCTLPEKTKNMLALHYVKHSRPAAQQLWHLKQKKQLILDNSSVNARSEILKALQRDISQPPSILHTIFSYRDALVRECGYHEF
jgi:hypothetical protein